MTFLDPVCTSDCPIIGAEMKEAGVLLGRQDADVELVAIVANPTYRSAAFTQAFDREEGLNTVPNWRYLTGSLSQLSQVWRQYGITVENLPAGAMSAHNDLAVVIDRTGHICDEVLRGGGIETAASAAAAAAGQWSRLTTLSALAASAPGRGCGLVAVNAVSFGPNNVPMAAGSCVRRGVAGVFTVPITYGSSG